MTDSESDSSVMELRDRSFDIFQSDLSEVDILDVDVSKDEVDSAVESSQANRSSNCQAALFATNICEEITPTRH